MRRLSLPLLLGLTHGIGDGAAGFLLASLAHTLNLSQVSTLVLLYNVLAFGGQPLAGWLVDRLQRPRLVALIGLPLMGLALLCAAWQPTFAVVLAGIGSAIFHVGGGVLAICATRDRASGPGIFAAPGVLGLALGGALAITHTQVLIPFLCLLILSGGALAVLNLPALPYTQRKPEPVFESHDWIMLTLLAAIALRSAVWSTLQYLLQGNVKILLLLAVAAASGKVLGGFLADWLGWRRWVTAALIGSAMVLMFTPRSIAGLMLGTALLQSATPAGLAAAARLMPRRPALAAGLTLGLAIALGGLPGFSGWSLQMGSPPILSLMIAVSALLFWFSLRPRENKNEPIT